MAASTRMYSAVLLTLSLLALSGQAGAQERSYQEMRAEVGRLYQAEAFAEAAALLEEALELYPDHLLANATNLAIMRFRLEDLEGSLEALNYGLDHGVWYSKYAFLADFWAPLRGAQGWEEFQARNEEARLRAQAEVEDRMEVILPEGYDPNRRYPLFIALHGGGENLDTFMPNWGSSILTEEFIVAFPQSTQMVAMDGFSWTEDVSQSMEEIRTAYDQVVGEYLVDPEEVLVGGFSSGGIASLEVVLQELFPVRGFVVLCPAIPEGFTVEKMRGARDRGVRGTLLTTEMDGRVEEQRRMDEIMTQAGLPHEFHVTPDVGHWYPDDLPERIDRAITHIRAGG